jgi:hypothetical protein
MHFMTAARRLYDRHGYARAPETDFAPALGFAVNGYRLSLADAAGSPA